MVLITIVQNRALLIIGGARSGKSAFGEKVAIASELDLHYVATARAGDAEMHSRIATHKARRDEHWTTHEAPTGIAAVLDQHCGPDTVMLIDCLTLWLSNLMERQADIERETEMLVAGLTAARGAVILISNEVGGGIVPDNALARTFRDAQGQLNQAVAQAADAVVLVAAGLPMVLKCKGKPVHGC